jgi:hypothetical protein
VDVVTATAINAVPTGDNADASRTARRPFYQDRGHFVDATSPAHYDAVPIRSGSRFISWRVDARPIGVDVDRVL